MRRGVLPVLVSFAGALTACAGAALGAAGPRALAIGVPIVPTAVYVQGDTVVVDIDAGGQTFQVQAASSARLSATFALVGRGVEVSATVEDFDASINNPLAGTQTASEADIEGPLVYMADRRGRVTVSRAPELSGLAAQVVTAEGLASSITPCLPGQAVSAGDSWVDTLLVESDAAGVSVSSRSILRFTTVGDTVVDGRSLLRVSFAGDTNQRRAGNVEGQDVSQAVTGDTEGYLLWDLQRGLLYSSWQTSDLVGTMEVSVAPFPLSIRQRSSSTVRLEGNEEPS